MSGLTLDLKKDPALYSDLMKIAPENRRMGWLIHNRPDLADRAMKAGGGQEALQDVPWYADPTNYSPISLAGGVGAGIAATAGKSLARKAAGAVSGAARDVGAQGVSLAAFQKIYDTIEKKYPDHPYLDTLAALMVQIGAGHVAGKVMNRFIRSHGHTPSPDSETAAEPSSAGTVPTGKPREITSVISVPPGDEGAVPSGVRTPNFSAPPGHDLGVMPLFREKLAAWKRASGPEKDKALRNLLDFMGEKGIRMDEHPQSRLPQLPRALQGPNARLALPERVIPVPPGGFKPPVIVDPARKLSLENAPVSAAEDKPFVPSIPPPPRAETPAPLPSAETNAPPPETKPPASETLPPPEKPPVVSPATEKKAVSKKKEPVRISSQQDDRTPQDFGLKDRLSIRGGSAPKGVVNAKELANAIKETGGGEIHFDPAGQRVIVGNPKQFVSLPAKVQKEGTIEIKKAVRKDEDLLTLLGRYGKEDVSVDAESQRVGTDPFALRVRMTDAEIPPASESKDLHTFTPAEAKEIAGVVRSIDKGHNSESFRSALIHGTGDGKIHVVGTDGHKLIEKVFPASSPTPFRLTLSGETLKKLLESRSPLTIAHYLGREDRAQAISGNRMATETSRNYPDYRQAFPEGDRISLSFPAEALDHLREMVSRKIQDVRMEYRDGKLTLDGGSNTRKTFDIPDAPPGSFALTYSPRNLVDVLSEVPDPVLNVHAGKEGFDPSEMPTTVTSDQSPNRGVVMPLGEEKSYVQTGSSASSADPSATMGFMGSQMLSSPALQKSLSLDKVKDFLKGAKETLGEHLKAPDTKAFQSYLSHLGEFERVSAQMDMEARHAMETFDALPESLQTRIMDDYEHGTLNANTPELQTLVKMGEFRQHLWEMVKGITGVSTDIPNYLAHIYKNPVEAEKLMGAFITRHGGIAGTMNYLKKRKISFYDVARDLGLEPLTTNPLRLQALTIRSLNRFLMAHHFKGELQRRGWALTPTEAQAYGVTGWVPISDKVMEGLVVPPEIHKIWRQNEMNQHLEGLLNPISSLSNKVNAINLGLSGFHFMTTSLSSMMRKGGLALSEIVNSGTLRGLSREDRMKMLKEGMKALSFLDAPYKYVKKGAEIRQRAKNLGMTAFGDYSEMTSSFPDTVLRAVALAGGRLQKPVQYQVAAHSLQESMKTLREGRHLEGIAAIIPATIEKLSEPLFDRWVPNLKIGIFSHFVETIMRENPGKTLEELTPELQKAWRAVDNSEGEVVYDNLGWSKTARMLAHLSVRSVGWNLGTLSLFKNAAVDYAKAVKGGFTNGEVRFTPDMGYIPMMIAVTGMAGSVIYGLQFGKLPDNLADALVPPQGKLDANGNIQYQYNSDGTIRRWMMPTYLKDIFSYGHDPEQTVINKLNPLFEMLAEQVQNRNYYGETIANPSDPVGQRVAERVQSALASTLPFSVTGMMQNIEHGETPVAIAAPLAGFMPAPKYISTSPAEELASRLAEDRMPTMKKSERDARMLHGQIEQELRSDRKKGLKDLQQALKDRKITMDTAFRMIRMANMTPMEYHVRVLPMTDILKVWDEAVDQKMVSPSRKAQDLQSLRKVLMQRVMANPESLGNLEQKDKEKILHILRGQEYPTGKAG